MIIGVIIILLIVFIGVKILYNIPKKIMENNNLKNEIVTLAETKLGNKNEVIIKFEKSTDFDWDKLYIITPYTNIEEYAQQKNIEGVRLINTDINTNDSDHLLVFISDKEIVSYLHYPREKGDFDTPRKKGYTPDQAVFEVKESQQDSGWLEMSNIK